MVTIYPPVGAGDMNEQGLTVLATAEDFDVLITGDMKDSTERKLVEQYPLPDVEVLLVGHHGSKYSSHEDFLAAVKPEIAIISVGDNSYGHPTAEAIGRLEAVGAVVRRTDEEGDITIYGGEEDGR
jgi:competence protein ComEC